MLKPKISQNMSALIGNIGEDMVLFKLYVLVFSHPHLEVYKNYSETGYDIGIYNFKTNNRIRIEVKTRQHYISSRSVHNLNSCHFTATENERNSSDFLIGYWMNENAFFIIPSKELKQSKSKNNKLFKLMVSKLKTGNTAFSNKSMPFLDNWESIIETII